jgi:hypothetical protein
LDRVPFHPVGRSDLVITRPTSTPGV